MRTTAVVLALLLLPLAAPAQVRVLQDESGARLQVDGRDFLVQGMNWDYFPIGTNYNYSLWTQPDDVIRAALANEMPLMKRMGVNALRLYAGIPARWIRYIHETYGIYTVLNHTVGRYGFTLDGAWIAQVDYSDPAFRAAVKAEVGALVDGYKDTPGLLMWMLGNENNYGLSWSSFEIEALPAGERDAARARYLYSLLGEIVRDVKARDPAHPVSIANGDLQYVDLVAEECKGLDVFGANVYRGRSARDLFQVVKDKLGIPVFFTEFGADAWDAKNGREDDVTQARYLLAQWEEIYEQSAGKGRVGNAIGGFVFQWSDGWWKYKQEENLDVHDTNASWPNGGYVEDFVEGQNNMNEEWWGIAAKGQPDDNGLYQLHPRSAYFALKRAFELPPYAPSTDLATIRAWFAGIEPAELASSYEAARAADKLAVLERVRLTNVLLSFETYSTGGDERWRRTGIPGSDGRGFDHTESAYLTAEARPTDRVVGSLTLNVLGHVAQNPIDEIFYERRGRAVLLQEADATGAIRTQQEEGIDRVKIYRSDVNWDDDHFALHAFYRSGHQPWVNEGDLFGLYRFAFYGNAIDVYDADAPLGVEIAGKRELAPFKLAIGPQLWWGANPAAMAMASQKVGPVLASVVYQEDLAQQGNTGTTAAIPPRATRKLTLALGTRLGPATLEVGGIWAGSTLEGLPFLDEDGDVQEVLGSDAFGAKLRLTVEKGIWHWYAQSAYMGLVAEGGPDPRITFTGWTLKDSGSGNQLNALTGVAVNLGPIQLGPNFLWQKPLVGPGPSVSGRPGRNIEADPFVVRANRETVAGELMLVFDPTPATWMWQWDNDLREDAPIAASLDVAYRHMPTGSDATFWFQSDGVTRFPFDRGPPAADVWEVNARVVSAPTSRVRLVAHAFAGNPQPNGDSPRQPRRYGGDVRVTWGQIAFAGFAKFNDWGPFDYYRDFNLTFPLQLMGDVSYTLGPARWLWLQQTRFGVRATQRWLNGYSGARFVPEPSDPSRWGSEYEIRTYLVVTM